MGIPCGGKECQLIQRGRIHLRLGSIQVFSGSTNWRRWAGNDDARISIAKTDWDVRMQKEYAKGKRVACIQDAF